MPLFFVWLSEVMNLNNRKQEVLFEKRLDALIVLKDVLIKRGEFHGKVAKDYYEALDKIFMLLV